MRDSSVSNRRIVVLLILCLLVISSLVPGRFAVYADWLRDPVEYVLAPVEHLLHTPVGWLRKRIDKPPVDEQTAAQLWDNLQNELRSSIRYEKEIEQLRMANQALRNLNTQLGQNAEKYVKPWVVAGPYDPADHCLKINMGSRWGLQVGQPVMDGANLVGQVKRVSAANAWVQLITAPESRMNAIITDAVIPISQLRAGQYLRCQIDAAGNDRFVTVVEKRYKVTIGQYVRLDDTDWPAAAQGLLIGQIVKIEDYPEMPQLRQRVHIRTFRSLRYLSRVDVVIPLAQWQDEGGDR